MAGTTIQPARFWVGPPAPAGAAWLARLLMLALLSVVGHWVRAELGGVAISPVPTTPGANDTGKLFNWHPVLMTLAFGVLMAEAVLAYQAPVSRKASRPTRKVIHASLNSAAVLLAVLGALAAYKSHSLKLPSPIPNLYSPHSWLGLTVIVLALVQFSAGFGAYLYPQAPLPVKLALGPLHKFGGKAVWVAGLAAIATGLQEKVTFIQLGKGVQGPALYTPIISLPAIAEILLVLLAAVVLYHHVPPAKPVEDDKEARQGLLTSQSEAEDV